LKSLRPNRIAPAGTLFAMNDPAGGCPPDRQRPPREGRRLAGRCWALAILIGVAALSVAAPRASAANLIDLGTLGGPVSIAYGINDVGQIVGTSATASGTSHAFLWSNGTMADLGSLGSMGPSDGRGINNRGQVVGGTIDANNSQYHAFLWDNGTMSDLGTLPEANNSEAFGLNDRGAVVGDSGNDSLEGHGVLWQAGNVTDLGDLGRPGTSAHAINDAGQVVGWSHNFESHVHAFLWEVGTMRDLGTLGQFSVASGVNETGAVVGQSDVGNGELHAALWPPSLPIHDTATIGAQVSPTSVIAGTPVTVPVPVQNQGSQVETFEFNVTSGGVVVGTVSVSRPSGASREILSGW